VTSILALAASLLWGAADFGGGMLSRKVKITLVILSSQAIGLVLLLIGLGLPDVHVTIGGYLGYAAASGVTNLVGIYFFYRAMARGPMSLAAPISACGTALPVIYGLARGESVAAIQIIGIFAAFAGVILASTSAARDGEGGGLTVLYALGAAAGFGSMFLFGGLASPGGVYGTMLLENSIGVLVLVPVMLMTHAARDLKLTRSLVILALAVGVGDIGANGAYLGATSTGHLAVASALSSLYPLASSLMARIWLSERLSKLQNIGVLAALGGIVLINM
jgi:drug/metabolite transporter (DMT)-like permease